MVSVLHSPGSGLIDPIRDAGITAFRMIALPCRSAVEHEPAYMIPQSLVIEHKVPDFVGKLVALPPALRAVSLFIVSVAFSARIPVR